jgi:hypothetical protein
MPEKPGRRCDDCAHSPQANSTVFVIVEGRLCPTMRAVNLIISQRSPSMKKYEYVVAGAP